MMKVEYQLREDMRMLLHQAHNGGIFVKHDLTHATWSSLP
jgi:hypothetical protein